MSEKQQIGFLETIIVSGEKTSRTVTAKCDSGAKRTSICQSVAEAIGVGEEQKTVTVNSSNGSEQRSVYEIDVQIGDDSVQTVLVSVTDRGEMKYDAILGRDILEDFLIDTEQDYIQTKEL